MSNNLLKGKRGIIFGALDEQSIAWKVAKKCHEQGAAITLTNAPVAMRFGKINELGEKINAEIIQADATIIEDLDNLLSKSQEILGGKIDFILHSIGMSLNVRKGRSYTDLNYEFMQKTFDISAISFHKLMQCALKQDAIQEGGSIVALTYIAAQRVFPDYSEMAISQSPTMTTAGSGIKGFQEFFDYANKMSPLGNASAEACADYCVLMFSDLSRMVTMQNLYHDGGFSNMGMNPAILNM